MVRILIVDDQELNRLAYKGAVEDANLGAEVLLAQNEHEAIKLIEDNDIDLVITDLLMINDTSGIDVLTAAKRKDPLTMVLIVTAYERKLDRYTAYDIGAFDCIVKGTAGVKTEQEIIAKTKNAIRFRNTALKEIESQRKLGYLKRYFDQRVFSTIERNPDLLSPQNRLITIVFWDIRGFSLLCEIMKAYPTLVSGFLTEFLETASKIIFKHRGVVDKFIGDSVMAIFGSLNGRDIEGREDAVGAVGAALDLRREFQSIYSKWLEKWTLYTPHKIDIGLGCGIHTGEALVGNMGTDLRDYYTALGANVNFAARIESLSHESHTNQIIISNTTNMRIDGHYKSEFVKTVDNIKNIAGTFDLYEIITA